MDPFERTDLQVGCCNIQNTKQLFAWVRKKTLQIRTKEFNGIKTIQWIRFQDHPMVDLEFTCKSGRAMLILVRKKKRTILSEEDIHTTFTLPIEKGWYRLRLVGIHADIVCSLKRH